MDYKEKLKAIINSNKTPFVDIDTFLKYFPELKESEDERIRKALLEMVHDTTGDELWVDYNIHKEEALAWLEKQGEPMEIDPTEFDTRLQTLIGKFDNLPKEELIGSLSFWLNVVQNDGTYKDEEKQGEQKPVVIIPKFRIGDNIKTTNEEPLTITKIDDKGYWSEDLLVCDFDDAAKWELVEQKPTDKVEPKFHEGDWVVISTSDGEKVVQIDSIEYFKSGEPRYITSEGRWFGNGTKAHLWTIQDAKDGDVLFQDLMCGKTFIYNGVSPDMAILYSFIISNDGKDVLPYHIGKPNTGIGNIEENKNIIHPATKKQCDLLFQKMHEAGYEWDAEKKELKKIEQKSQRMISAEAKEAMYDKPVWSEEDEWYMSGCIGAIATKDGWSFEEKRKTKHWLKSLKERIGG